MLLKHRQDGFGGEGNLYVHAVTHSVRILTDGSGETASTPKIVSDVAARLICGWTEKTMRPPVGGLIARASFPAALHQAAGGWRPAPFHSWPKGRRPFRESPRRHPDPWWPLQTSKRLPLVPLDIFFPAQSGSPLLPVTLRRSRSDYALRRNPFRGNSTKVNLRRGLCPGGYATACGVSPRREVSRFLVDEMKPGAGEADDGHIGIGIGFAPARSPEANAALRAQPRAFENYMPAHRREYAELARRVTSVCLRSWGLVGWGSTRLLRLASPDPEEAADGGGLILPAQTVRPCGFLHCSTA